MSEKIKPLNLIEVIKNLLASDVEINIVRDSFKRGGLRDDEVEYLIAYIFEQESSRAVNLFHQHMTDIKNSLGDVLSLLKSG